jgi:hypothetical protein
MQIGTKMMHDQSHGRHVHMTHLGPNLERFTILLLIIYFMTGDKNCIETSKK